MTYCTFRFSDLVSGETVIIQLRGVVGLKTGMDPDPDPADDFERRETGVGVCSGEDPAVVKEHGVDDVERLAPKDVLSVTSYLSSHCGEGGGL